MSAYTYLASSKEMVLPEEMEQYNRHGIFDNAQMFISLNEVTRLMKMFNKYNEP